MSHTHTPRRRRTSARALALLLSMLSLAAPLPAAPQREHLTPEEVEQVRNNQSLDKRIGVFVRAVERRLGAISDPASAERLSAKEAGEWGTLKGTRAQLLSDVGRIIEEAVTNIEDATIHSEKSPLIPSSLRRLGEAARGFLPQIVSLRERVEDEREQALLGDLAESLEEIVAAAGKLPPEEKKTADKKKADKKKEGSGGTKN